MKTQDKHRKPTSAALLLIYFLIAVGVIFTLSGCSNRSESQATAPARVTPAPPTAEPTLTAQPTPGLLVSGTVRDSSGVGVENVHILRSYSALPGVVIATTDANGYYASPFSFIPGDEMVTIQAEKPGFTFEPANYIWRHYYGYENKQCNFEVSQP